MLLQLLSLENVRQLEDLIIDAIYRGIIEGRLDQENNVVHYYGDCYYGLGLLRLLLLIYFGDN